MYTLANSMAAMEIRGPLLEILESEGDIHVETASRILGKPKEKVLDKERQETKICNFGLSGGMGARRFHEFVTQDYGLSWDYHQAYEKRELWFQVFWDVKLFLGLFKINPYKFAPPSHSAKLDWLRELGFEPDVQWPSHFDLSRALQNGELYTSVLPSGRVVPRRRFSSAANIFFQGPGGETITLAFVKLCRALVYGSAKIVVVVHDSIVIEVAASSDVPVDPNFGTILEDCMQEAQKDVCPLVPAPRPQHKITTRLA